MTNDKLIQTLRDTIAWELNILEVEVQPVVKVSRRDWLNRRIKRLKEALELTSDEF